MLGELYCSMFYHFVVSKMTASLFSAAIFALAIGLTGNKIIL